MAWFPCLPPACCLLLLLYIVLGSLYDLIWYGYDMVAWMLLLQHARSNLLDIAQLAASHIFSLSRFSVYLGCGSVRCCSTTSQLFPYCGMLNVAPGVKRSTGNAKRSVAQHLRSVCLASLISSSNTNRIWFPLRWIDLISVNRFNLSFSTSISLSLC